MSKTKINIRKIVFTLLWCATAVAGIVLLVAAVKSKNVKTCKGVEIEISGVSNNFFIDRSDVLKVLSDFVGGDPAGRTINRFNLKDIERNLETQVWVKNAELYFDNNEMLRVYIDEREPVARVFTSNGNSFYIDSSLKVLPLSDKFSAMLPVFTDFPAQPGSLSKADTVLLRHIRNVSMAIVEDEFLFAMIDQVNITEQRGFMMQPKMGQQQIDLGDASDLAEKFAKLKMFYRNIMPKAGWSKYSVITLTYKNQVVAKLKDMADRASDSLRALQIMQAIVERAARLAADSMQVQLIKANEKLMSDSSMIQQSVQRDEPELPSTLPAEKPVIIIPATAAPDKIPAKVNPVKPAPKPVNAKPAGKPAAKPASTEKRVPKAVMGGN